MTSRTSSVTSNSSISSSVMSGWNSVAARADHVRHPEPARPGRTGTGSAARGRTRTIAGSTWATSTSGTVPFVNGNTWIVHQSPRRGTAVRVTFVISCAGVVDGRQRIVDRAEELETLHAAAAPARRLRRPRRESLLLLLLDHAVGDVHRAPDRARDVAALVDRHAAGPGDPMDRPVRPHHPVLHAVRRLRVHRSRGPCPATTSRSSGCSNDTYMSKVPSKPPGGNPNNASNRASHTVSPVAMFHRHVPNPPASNAARKCSVRSRVRCSAIRSVSHLLGPVHDRHTVPSSSSNRPSRRANPHRPCPSRQTTTRSPVFAFPRRDEGQVIAIGVQRLGRREHLEHRSPGHLVLRPTEQPLGLRRPQHDSASRIGHHDRPRQCINDGSLTERRDIPRRNLVVHPSGSRHEAMVTAPSS